MAAVDTHSTPAVFGPAPRRCAEDLLELNLMKECSCGCLACQHDTPGTRRDTVQRYAQTRVLFDSPEALGLDRGLPGRVAAWVEETGRAGELPRYVTVGFGAEPLPGFEEAERILEACLKPLFTAGVGVSLQTRKLLPDRILDLLAEHRGLTRVTIPISALSAETLQKWEPRTASANQRLFNVQRLRSNKVPVLVAIKPLIPFVNDDSGHLTPLCRAIADSGVRRLTAEFMRLTQVVRHRLEAQSPVSTQLIFGAYAEQLLDAREDRTRPRVEHRRLVYRRIAQVARERRLRFGLCRCADPVLGRDPCLLWPGDASAPDTTPSRRERVRNRRRPIHRASQVGFPELLDGK